MIEHAPESPPLTQEEIAEFKKRLKRTAGWVLAVNIGTAFVIRGQPEALLIGSIAGLLAGWPNMEVPKPFVGEKKIHD